MGLVVSICGAVAACVGGCLGSCVCCALGKGNSSDFRVSKFLALLLQITAVTLILVIQSTEMSSWLGSVPVINDCGEDEGCYARQVAYRVSFATSCVFLFHLVLSLGRCCANKVLNSFWIFKFVFLIGVSAAVMFVPNGVCSVWGSIAEILSSWFLVIQMVYALDFGYGWNDIWITNAREDKVAGKSGKPWYYGLLLFSLAFLVGAYVWFGYSLHDFGSYHSNRAIIWTNLALCTVFGIASLFAPRGGLLPAALTILYIAWLSWSTAWSGSTFTEPSDSRLGVGMTLAFLVLLYATARKDMPHVSSQASAVVESAVATTGGLSDPAIVAEAPPQQGMEEGTVAKANATTTDASWKDIVFINLMHLSVASYFMCLTISWQNSPDGEENLIFYWVQAVSAWVMLALYAWTLVAPAVCTSRQF